MATTERTNNWYGDRTLIVKANGGTVTVSKKVGVNWVVIDSFNADGAWIYSFGATPTKITPAGGAEYEVTQ